MTEPTVTRDVDANVRVLRDLTTTESVQTFYDKWAEHYDQDLTSSNYNAPSMCAKALEKVLSDKSAPLVDCAAGTGLAGQELAKLGYKRIDAVDISQKSLDISASKGVYERLICDKLGANKLKGVKDGYYAGLICSGGLGIQQISHDAFSEWNRIVKQGGYMCFTFGGAVISSDQEKYSGIINNIDAAIASFIDKGVWELVEKTDISYFLTYTADLYTIRRL